MRILWVLAGAAMTLTAQHTWRHVAIYWLSRGDE
jgi:hypothetical protein